MIKSEYHKYLASREWALLKNAVNERSKGGCERCGIGKHEATHHLTYERIGKESLDDLVGICEDCHEYLSGKSTEDPAKYAISLISQAMEGLWKAFIALNCQFFAEHHRDLLDKTEFIMDQIWIRFEKQAMVACGLVEAGEVEWLKRD